MESFQYTEEKVIMDVDNQGGTAEITTTVIQSLPKIDESRAMDDRPAKERLITVLDMLESHVEKIRREAARLEEERDQILATLDSVRNTDLMFTLDENDVDDVCRYADRISNRAMTVEVRILTQRDKMQEDALCHINHLIDNLVMDIRNDHEVAKTRCLSYVNACSSNLVDSIIDKNFESTLLGCTIDDQKRVKKRLQGLLNYFEKLRVQTLQ